VKQVVPAADLRYFDGGHFVLDEDRRGDHRDVLPIGTDTPMWLAAAYRQVSEQQINPEERGPIFKAGSPDAIRQRWIEYWATTIGHRASMTTRCSV
jgi:hypothetical protein